MRIVGARWTRQVNMLQIECGCGHHFEHRADRWKVRCPKCQATGHLAALRDRYAEDPPTD